MIDIKVKDMNEYDRINELYQLGKSIRDNADWLSEGHLSIDVTASGIIEVKIFKEIKDKKFKVTFGEFSKTGVLIREDELEVR